jgi:hypothetical protein
MIHYFITWFEYNDHRGNTGDMYYMEGMKPEYQTQKVHQESWFSLWGVILGTCYLHHEARENLGILNIQGRVRILWMRHVQVLTTAGARESSPRGCQSRCLSSRA